MLASKEAKTTNAPSFVTLVATISRICCGRN